MYPKSWKNTLQMDIKQTTVISKQVSVINGDLLNASERVIIQQLNCTTIKAHGLSKSIAQKYPFANVYRRWQAINTRNHATWGTCGIPGEIAVSNPTLLDTWNKIPL
jgi:hypothetical protein